MQKVFVKQLREHRLHGPIGMNIDCQKHYIEGTFLTRINFEG